MTADHPTFRFPSRPELRWAAGFAAIVMALTCLPYLYGLLIKPEDAYYSGFLTNPDEHNVYLAYMKEYQKGTGTAGFSLPAGLFLIDPFTSEPQQGRVINLFFLALGRSAALKHIPLPVEYHLARLVSGWLLLMAIYCLAAQAIEAIWARRLALALAAFASGFGWLYHPAPGQPHPIDYGPGLVMPEAITFLTLLLNPLFCFSVFLMTVAIGLGAHAIQSGSLRSAALAGLACLLLGNIHTYDIIPVAVVLASYLLMRVVMPLAISPSPVLERGPGGEDTSPSPRVNPERGRGTGRGSGGGVPSPSPVLERGPGGEDRTRGREALRSLAAAALIALIALIASPSLLYQLWLLKGGEVTLAIKASETPVNSPEPIFLIRGLGLPLLLGVLGILRALRRGSSDGARLLALWLALGFALIYLPVPFQRKLAQGVQIPAVLLAVVAIEPVLNPLRARALLGLALVALCLPSNLFYLRRAAHDLETNNTAYVANFMPPLYLRDDQRAALAWLDRNASSADIVLCNSFLGSYAPSLAGTRVYVGHWAETLRFPEKLGDFASFLRAGDPESSKQALVTGAGIRYVIRDRSIYDEASLLSPEGKSLPAFDLDRAPWLERVWSGGRVAVYRVRPNAA
ncbi:MAG: hypothetical protein ACE149_07755 [Armatimonadota bacterium]